MEGISPSLPRAIEFGSDFLLEVLGVVVPKTTSKCSFFGLIPHFRCSCFHNLMELFVGIWFNINTIFFRLFFTQ